MDYPEFSRELNKAVQTYFSSKKNGKYATPFAWLKVTILLSLYFIMYFSAVFWTTDTVFNILLYVAWGVISLLLVFNVGHDAVHNAFSKYTFVNKILGYSFNLVGANSYSWKLKHNEAHHNFTNIKSLDHDPELTPFMRVSPQEPYLGHYRWQPWYWIFVYSLFSLLIIFIADILIFFQVPRNEYRLKQPLSEWIILFLTKALYILIALFIPVTIGNFSATELCIAFVLLHFVNGIIIGLVFQPSHYFYESVFYENDESLKNNNWFVHQLNTTTDIAPQNRLLSQVLGCLNANVPHHLFPRICHVHYPDLSELVKETCMKHKITYHRKSFGEAIRSHVKHIKVLSRE